MEEIPEQSIDMILCDLPYGTTQNRWDVIIDPAALWKCYSRIMKPSTPIILFGQDKFSAEMMLSKREWHRYNLIWQKTTPTGWLNAKKMPLRSHEDIMVFYKEAPTYNPQKTTGHPPTHTFTKHTSDGTNYGKTKLGVSGGGSTERYPTSVLTFKTDKQTCRLHPTQKPVALCEYLIKTYSNIGDKVLDNCMGSGTTGVSCLNMGRKFVGIELDTTYCDIATARIQDVVSKSS